MENWNLTGVDSRCKELLFEILRPKYYPIVESYIALSPQAEKKIMVSYASILRGKEISGALNGKKILNQHSPDLCQVSEVNQVRLASVKKPRDADQIGASQRMFSLPPVIAENTDAAHAVRFYSIRSIKPGHDRRGLSESVPAHRHHYEHLFAHMVSRKCMDCLGNWMARNPADTATHAKVLQCLDTLVQYDFCRPCYHSSRPHPGSEPNKDYKGLHNFANRRASFEKTVHGTFFSMSRSRSQTDKFYPPRQVWHEGPMKNKERTAFLLGPTELRKTMLAKFAKTSVGVAGSQMEFSTSYSDTFGRSNEPNLVAKQKEMLPTRLAFCSPHSGKK